MTVGVGSCGTPTVAVGVGDAVAGAETVAAAVDLAVGEELGVVEAAGSSGEQPGSVRTEK